MGLAVFAVVLISRESTHRYGSTPLSAIGIYLTVIVVARSFGLTSREPHTPCMDTLEWAVQRVWPTWDREGSALSTYKVRQER